jgi:hypothetical protein
VTYTRYSRTTCRMCVSVRPSLFLPFHPCLSPLLADTAWPLPFLPTSRTTQGCEDLDKPIVSQVVELWKRMAGAGLAGRERVGTFWMQTAISIRSLPISLFSFISTIHKLCPSFISSPPLPPNPIPSPINNNIPLLETHQNSLTRFTSSLSHSHLPGGQS